MLTNCHVNNWANQVGATSANQFNSGPTGNQSLVYDSNNSPMPLAPKPYDSIQVKEAAGSHAAKCPQPDAFRLGQHASMCQKRHRTTFKYYQVNILEEAFKQNNYPSPSFREAIARETNLDVSRVQVWFQNRRAKHKRQLNQAMRCFVASAAATSKKSTSAKATTSSQCQRAVAVVNQCAAQLQQQMALGLHLNSIQQYQQQQQQYEPHEPQQQQQQQQTLGQQSQQQQSLQQAALCSDVLALAASRSDGGQNLQQSPYQSIYSQANQSANQVPTSLNQSLEIPAVAAAAAAANLQVSNTTPTITTTSATASSSSCSTSPMEHFLYNKQCWQLGALMQANHSTSSNAANLNQFQSGPQRKMENFENNNNTSLHPVGPSLAITKQNPNYELMRPLNSPVMVNEAAASCHRRVADFVLHNETGEQRLHEELLQQQQLQDQQQQHHHHHHSHMGTHLEATATYQPLDCQNHPQSANIHDQYT